MTRDRNGCSISHGTDGKWRRRATEKAPSEAALGKDIDVNSVEEVIEKKNRALSRYDCY